ncbi:MAG: hypothetical protein H0W88_04025 [Parachlamydiaceae bacterium]|nr:hypothetical protein [Parachlamydiaceae bacterium]
MLTHEVVFKNELRYYLHRFLYLDKNLIVQKISKPFIFRHMGVEFCCGMTFDHSYKNLIMTIGIEDREAYFSIIDLDSVQSLLESLPISQ